MTPLPPRFFYSFLYTFFFLFLLHPVFRLFITCFYYFFLCHFFWPSPDISICNSISDITQSSGNSNSINPAEHFQEDINPNNLHDEHPIGENEGPNHNGIPVDVVDLFRRQNQEMELELFARIRLLENRMIEGLPPQLNLGEYETLVRGFLDDTLTIDHYYTTISNELFDITVLELKANLLEQLFNLLMSGSSHSDIGGIPLSRTCHKVRNSGIH